MTHTRSLALCGLALVALCSAPAAAQRSPVDTLAWLAGCWRLAGATTTVDEQWLAPNGGVMLGVSRTVSNGTAREHEFLRIYAAGDTLVYAAIPSRQQPTEFRARSVSPTEVVFENPAHDFPQRIRYRRSGADLLVATIEGDRDGKRHPVVFSYARGACGATDGARSAQAAPAPASREAAAAASADTRAALQPKYDSLGAAQATNMGAINSWFAEQADASFSHVMWIAGGTAVPVGGRQVLAQAGEQMRAANLDARYRNRKYSSTIEKVLVRGDTAEALVASSQSWVFTDSAGRYGAPGAEQSQSVAERRLDRWVRTGSGWRLRQAAIIGQEVVVGGRVISRDGKAQQPPPK
jgi:hypothetical protein